MGRINRTARMRKVAQKRLHSMSRAKRMKRIFNALFHRSGETPYTPISGR